MNSEIGTRGITVLELLIMIGLLLLLAAFVAPIVSLTSAETEMNTALTNLESSIELARRTAQVYGTSVVLHVQTDQNEPDSHSLTLPSLSQSALHESWDFLEAETRDYLFPKSVHLMSEQNAIRFDKTGRVADPVHLVLVSHKDSELVEHVVIE